MLLDMSYDRLKNKHSDMAFKTKYVYMYDCIVLRRTGKASKHVLEILEGLSANAKGSHPAHRGDDLGDTKHGKATTEHAARIDGLSRVA